MDLTSKGQRTDIVMDSLETSLENTRDYIVVRTPLLPDYYAGNKIIFSTPAKNKSELEGWISLYQTKFDVSAQGFIHFSWDKHDPKTKLSLFTNDGFSVFSGQTMSTARVEKPARFNEEVTVRTIDWQVDLESWIKLHLDPDWDAPVDFQKRYWKLKGEKLQQFQEIFPGQRWVIEQEGNLVADLGLYAIKNIARFHAPIVDVSYRNQGFASRLMFEASNYAKQCWDVDELILIAETDSRASKLYKQLGFSKIEDFFDITKILPKHEVDV